MIHNGQNAYKDMHNEDPCDHLVIYHVEKRVGGEKEKREKEKKNKTMREEERMKEK